MIRCCTKTPFLSFSICSIQEINQFMKNFDISTRPRRKLNVAFCKPTIEANVTQRTSLFAQIPTTKTS